MPDFTTEQPVSIPVTEEMMNGPVEELQAAIAQAVAEAWCKVGLVEAKP